MDLATERPATADLGLEALADVFEGGAVVPPAVTAVLEALPDCVVLIGAGGQELFCNRAARALSVHRRIPSHRDLWADLWGAMSPFDLPDFHFEEASFAERLAGGESFSNDVQFFRDREGSGRWVSATGRPVVASPWRNGAFGGGLLTLRDVTDSHSTQWSLRVNEEKLRLAADGVEDVLWTMNPIGSQLTFLSSGFERIWGVSAKLAYQDSSLWVEGIHAEDRARVFSIRQDLFGGVSYDEIYRVIHQDGSVRWLRDRARPVKDGRGEVYLVVGWASDITTLIETQFELVRKSEELAQSNQELEQFARVASHDLQQPLRMVELYTQILSMDYGYLMDEAGREFMAHATDGARRMRRMVRGLLDFSRVRIDDRKLVPVDLQSVVDRVMSDVSALTVEVGASISVQPGLPTVLGDPSLLERLFLNLLINAVRYGPMNRTEVVLRHKAAAGQVRVFVADNGFGIRGADQDRIFDPFHRLDPADTIRPGTGMGLAIARRIAQLHHGRLTVQSVEGEGSCFMVEFPVVDHFPE